MKIILDSNIIIYMAIDKNSFFKKRFIKDKIFVSAATKIEVLGYHRLTSEDKFYFELFFNKTEVIQVKNDVVERAIKLKQHQKMSLGDALIAATAILNNMPLVTKNSDDFENIENLEVINPFDNTK